MSNWAKLQEDLIGLPVAKRARHGIHFDKGKGLVQAEFVGKPCHYFDGKEYRAIDTKPLLRKDGSYGCPHSDVIIKPDGTVQVGTYYQKAALIYPQSLKVDGDRLVREFTGGRQYLYITENGFRQEIVLDKLPDLRKVSALVDTISGVLPSKYTASGISLKDADRLDFTADKTTLASVLEAAKYPLTIDPDFAGGTADAHIYNTSSDYNTARSTSGAEATTTTSLIVGQRLYGSDYSIYRVWIPVDTSSIDDDAIITQVNLKLTPVDTSDADTAFDVQIVKFTYSATREVRYDNLLSNDADDSILGSTSTMSNNTQVTSGNLSNAWIVKDGTTYYGLRSSRDVSATAPTAVERMFFASASNATESYRPVLTVTYTASGIAIPVAQYYYNRLRRN